ncbi:hypothetical protein [Burkholderia cepacia]|uniref:hypothetical protein n=1 Tax=Burkholderia cepacia TaxID=292 RepID=UPI002ABDB01C|nr:hypothetical protein [Burkholderia cepacia]
MSGEQQTKKKPGAIPGTGRKYITNAWNVRKRERPYSVTLPAPTVGVSQTTLKKMPGPFPAPGSI